MTDRSDSSAEGVKGAVEDIKGTVKETAGTFTGNDSLEREGKGQQEEAAQENIAEKQAEADLAEARDRKEQVAATSHLRRVAAAEAR
ncbi:CsbD family protein [Amycolatopsis sp. lyj-112]|uniref:CsbD family protein n=1 Tax=Amycolatopsis sp. lyj-112 TaxID=2789288 RepID=UPI003979CA84